MELWTPAFRAVTVTALVLLVGVPPTLSFVVVPELERRGLDSMRARRAARSLIAATLIGAGLGASALAVGNAGSSTAGSFLAWAGSTEAGGAWVAFVVAASVGGAATVGRAVSPGRISRRRWLGIVTAGAFAMLVAFCWTRYSVAVESPAVAVLVKVGHMAGGGLWVGGLAVLAVLPRLVVRDDDAETTAFVLSVVRRFSIVAVAGVTIAVTTGVVIAAWHVPTLDALVATPYGILLSAKVGLVLVAAAMGGFNRFVLHEWIAVSTSEPTDTAILPGMLTVDPPQIAANDAVATVARSVRLELAVLLSAIGLSVALTTLVTPSYELLEPAATASSEIVRGVSITRFATLLELGAIAVGLAGALALGYELGTFDTTRERSAGRTGQQPRDD